MPHSSFYTMRSALSLALVAASVASATQNSCCDRLYDELNRKVVYLGSTQYNTTRTGFFSGQCRDDTPSCIVQPSRAEDVARAVEILVKYSCQFSVKGGGHTPWAGAASINGGITIDMAKLDTTTLNHDNTIASIGAGSRWGEVYNTLIPTGYMIAGGRDSTVGVGGLILGGGYSWFAPVRGFVCDSVVNYELVNAEGDIINANENENSDLYLALKGGSNNFGIVTRFDMTAFPQGDLWGGLMIYPESTGPAQIAAFVDFTNHIKDDTHANMINIWSYQQVTGAKLILNCLEYTLPTPNPPAYNEFLAIQPLIASTMRVSNISSFTDELAAASTQNERYLFQTATFELSADMYQKAVDISNAHLEPFLNTVGLTWSLLFQPIPRIVSDASVAAGGNILGVDRNAGNLMLFLIYITWDKPSDDAVFTKAAQDTMAEILAAGATMGVNNPYIYLNYANKDQDVLGGYGAANKAYMAKISAKYDPNGVFQKLVPGGWKIANSAGSGV